jgi:hypothetical protein
MNELATIAHDVPPAAATSAAAPRSTAEPRILFWCHAAAFGALWGALEITLGSFIHALHIPLGSAALAGLGAGVLVAQRQILPARGLTLATALVAAVCKSISPGGVILGPMIAILSEGVLVELILLPAPRARAAAPIAGGLAAAWCVLQKLVTQLVLFGAGIIDVYLALLQRGCAWLGLPPSGGLWTVAGVLAAIAALGAVGGALGRSVGARARERLAARPARAGR